MRIGIVDLGTNSMRVAVYEISGHRQRCIYKKKHMLRIGDGVFTAGRLKPSTRKKIIQALERFASRAQKMGVEHIEAVATSALREAKNRREIVRAIRLKAGIEVQVISGAQEARLIAEGILANESLFNGDYILVDIGGGSTEFSWVRKGRRLRSASVPLGALRMQQCFFPDGHRGTINQRLTNTRMMRRHVEAVLKNLKAKQRPFAQPLMVGSSGTIRAVARLLHPPLKPWQKGKTRKLKIHIDDLEDLVQLMLHLNRTQLLRLKAMESKRADIIFPGALLLFEMMKSLQVEVLKTSSFSLRDGVIARAIQRKNIQSSRRPKRV